MKSKIVLIALCVCAAIFGAPKTHAETPTSATSAAKPATHVFSVKGTQFLLDGKPFYFQGLSFFNALYNKEFNASPESREKWLRTFKSYGITSLRIWCDWRVTNGWIDEGPDSSLFVYPEMAGRNRLYEPKNPKLNPEALARLKALIEAADKQGMVIEVCLFTHYLVYPLAARNEYLRLVTEELRPYRNIFFEVWNEYNDHTVDHCRLIKQLDPDRLVGNSAGGSSKFGSDEDCQALDILCPHTARKPANANFWEVAPQEIKQLLEKYGKPVLDDEPARCGTRSFGGNENTQIEWHIAQHDRVREFGGYHTYHHDMFQLPYGNPSTPPSGIPDPEFSPFHKKAFEYLRSIAPKEVVQ